MFTAAKNLIESVRKPRLKEVFFPSLPFNRRLLLWYASRLVRDDSRVEPLDQLQEIDRLRRSGSPLTFICNHLTYADSHIIEVLMARAGLRELADHLVHIAGQKTFQISRRPLTRSLNTVRVYQPKANIAGFVKKRMNTRALRWAARLKRKGYSLLVYPEGTRTRLMKHFNLHSANPKTTIYFRQSFVIPLALMGSEKIMPVGSVLQRPATVHLKVGAPISHSEFEDDVRRQEAGKSDREFRQILMTRYMEQINHLLDPDYRYTGDPAPHP
ncbi:MAG TPA: 1-acyl-sn-glycerol-3-phosphate acyltransferase [Acidobacteriota bacterium]|nr:1-acyl-sn-glycerol-3-phosphate acyltransferase [Acidobacteriota bacterium]